MTVENQEPVVEGKKAGSAKKIMPPKERPSASAVLSSIGLLILEILLPALAAGGVLIWLFGGYNLWQMMGKTSALVVFAIVMVVIALLLAVVLDSISTPLRNRKKGKSIAFVRDPRTRLVKLVLGGLVLPLVAFGAINFVPYPAHGTVMNYLIQIAVPPVKLTPPDEVGAIALRANNPATKQLSIQVLQGFQSPEGLNQLIRIFNEDSSALSNPAVSSALRQAIASYGVTARDPLLMVFKSIDPGKYTGSGAVSGDLYDRYFAPSFESLSDEINSKSTDPAAREAQLARLQAAQAQLKSALAEMRYTPAKGKAGEDPRLDFILQVFLDMELEQEANLLSFARATAVDARYSSQVRGSALLLIGKLGEQKDLDLLYAQLKSTDDLLLARALQAINTLQTRLAGGNRP